MFYIKFRWNKLKTSNETVIFRIVVGGLHRYSYNLIKLVSGKL